MFSFWERESFVKNPDVIILGSGIVGLNAALELKKTSPHIHVVVLERGMLPYGASTRNAGFACFGSISELLDDLKVRTHDEVFSLIEKRWRGLQKLRQTLGDNSIMYEPYGGYEAFTDAEEQLYNECAAQINLFNERLKEITGHTTMYKIADDKINSFGLSTVKHLIHNTGEGQIDTGRMMKSLIVKVQDAGVEILSGAEVTTIEDNGTFVRVDLKYSIPGVTFSITSKKILICTNGFAKKFLPGEDIIPARSQVLITTPIPDLKIKGSFHYDKGFYYFRNVGHRILLGGGRNLDFENENTVEFGITEKIQERLEQLLRTMIIPYTSFEIDMRWSGIMGLGSVKQPIVKRTGANTYCAVRMGGMGVAIGSLVGEEASAMITADL